MIIEIPSACPACEYPLELVKDQLFCRNTACGAQLNGKLIHFCKVLGIKGFGPRTVEKLNLADITELFYLDRAETIAALGSEKTAIKLLDELERARGADLATVLHSFSIPLVGDTASNKISARVRHISEITYEACKEAGLGEKVTNNLLDWLATEYLEVREFLPFSFTSKSIAVRSVPTQGTVCITGKLKSFRSKSQATEELNKAGYTVVESVTKSTTHLIDETDATSAKRKKAEEYGITIVTNLINFLKENTHD